MAEHSRAQASLVIQLRTGHVPLNVYLHRISKLDQPLCHCQHCGSGDETVHHYLFECTAWVHKRWSLGRRMGRASKSLCSLLSTEWGVDEVLKYIGWTRRFKDYAW